mmetsp:Transcript_17086/g.32473  ORF Transcript_17086/g.32473 Transcript_17086/m.32473 type:complete len:249 (-) Transcript_17086:223-969(-)|eukprot:CAMPEP_0167816430 /NCGR_PEP_ID=MMETSP0112_2-20121227/3596_1 /TAXON_ID=91324 /ORGANISM="Lotharella globosa, Strain CCCM811" /LENGTH=248 /DNA_ID=CAMNT_0007716005 /DNA_START=15 /DNA_END=761 /DNA_ORIENTATION=-
MGGITSVKRCPACSNRLGEKSFGMSNRDRSHIDDPMMFCYACLEKARFGEKYGCCEKDEVLICASCATNGKNEKMDMSPESWIDRAGAFYTDGENEKAERCFSRAARHSPVLAQLFRAGQSFSLFPASGTDSHGEADYRLGLFYDELGRVSKDEDRKAEFKLKAITWFGNAAKRGHSGARVALQVPAMMEPIKEKEEWILRDDAQQHEDLMLAWNYRSKKSRTTRSLPILEKFSSKKKVDHTKSAGFV